MTRPRGSPPSDLHRERVGDGDVVVLTHGLGDDHTTWSSIVVPLSRRHTVVWWDLRGHGNSRRSDDPEWYTQPLAIADLCAVIDEAQPPVHLIGHSLGGYLSLAVALPRPHLVSSVTLIASGPGYRDPEARQAWNLYVGEAVRGMAVPAAAAGLARQEDSFVIDHVAELVPPLLVVVGERDQRFHAGAEYLARTVPSSTLVRIAGAGHHPQRTHPDRVVEAVLPHLAAARPAAKGLSP